jgi:hypothetical protein
VGGVAIGSSALRGGFICCLLGGAVTCRLHQCSIGLHRGAAMEGVVHP